MSWLWFILIFSIIAGIFIAVMQKKSEIKYREEHPETKGLVLCPRCHSTQITAVTENKAFSSKTQRFCMNCKNKF